VTHGVRKTKLTSPTFDSARRNWSVRTPSPLPGWGNPYEINRILGLSIEIFFTI
jgi:hypothetical protein